MSWFALQPASALWSIEVQEKRYTVAYLHIGLESKFSAYLLKRFVDESLDKNVSKLQQPTFEEIQEHTDKVFGVDRKNSKVLNISNTLQDIILPALIQNLFGLPCHRNPSSLLLFRRYVLSMGVETLVVGQPRSFKSLLVPVFSMLSQYYRRERTVGFVPVIQRQLIPNQTTELNVGKVEYDLSLRSSKFA
ncbi:MAG: hypothetical protein LQ344_001951 [Seirophora lacunosa]|nr:MAG: hypothetical protein LQ344_001951 [Seirophora lacunosa]